MKTPRLWIPSALCGALLLASSAANAAELVKPSSVKALVSDGKHNAFTALVRWKDQLWLSFRTAKDHNSQDGDLIVMRSSDGNEWSVVHKVDAVPDDRDPQFLATPNRLILYDAAMKGPELTTLATYTEDGEKWSEPKAVYEPRYIVWKPFAAAGRYYSGSHKKAEGGDAAKVREARLITSTDGLEWKTVSTIRAGNWESETTIYFPSDDRAIAFLRQKYAAPGTIHEAKAPFTEWTSKPLPLHMSGHAIEKIGGVWYLFSRTLDGGKTGTMIYTLDGTDLTPYCELPSGGDCSYPGAVQQGDEMLVSYYSSHEGTTNIYLARVPLKK